MRGTRGRRFGQSLYQFTQLLVSTTARSPSSLHLKTPKAFLASTCTQEAMGPFKEAGTKLHEAKPLPLRAGFSHTLKPSRIYVHPASRRQKKKNPDSSPASLEPLPQVKTVGLLGFLPESALWLLQESLVFFNNYQSNTNRV